MGASYCPKPRRSQKSPKLKELVIVFGEGFFFVGIKGLDDCKVLRAVGPDVCEGVGIFARVTERAGIFCFVFYLRPLFSPTRSCRWYLVLLQPTLKAARFPPLNKNFDDFLLVYDEAIRHVL